MIELQIDFLQYDFMRSALAAGLVASVLCSIIGIYVILNKVVFISDGIAHAAFGGIGFGYFLGMDPLSFGIISAVLTALGIGTVSSRSRVSEDTAIGVFLSTGMALGIIFMSLSKGYAKDLYGYLFGNILAVTWNDVFLILALTLAVLILVFLLYKEFLILSFDPVYGEAIGLPVQRLRLLLLCMVAFSVVVLIKIVGIIMVIALLTIPGAISRQHMKSIT
ncbi:MAG: metal ABC transporter permease, partial [Methanothrix sp.]|nr:metal ABC transporter permease [Methanothrix sp.]